MIKLLQLSDLHLSMSDDAKLASFQQVILHAKQQTIDAILLTGDLSQDGSSESYQQLHQICIELKVPVYGIAGNHDDFDKMQHHLAGGLIQLPHRLDLDSWQIIFVDTNLAEQVYGHLTDQDLRQLQQSLAQVTKHTLIVMHHPPFSVGSLWMDNIMLDNALEFWQIVLQYPQVKAVVCGHVHQAFQGYFQKVMLLTTPSTGRQFKPGVASFEEDCVNAGYRWLHLTDDGEVMTGINRV